jgi:sortase A
MQGSVARLRLPTWREATNLFAGLLALALFLSYVSPAAEPDRKPRVERLLDRLARTGDGKVFKKSPVAVSDTRRVNNRSVFIAPERGSRSSIGRLTIPSIGVKVPFYEGVHDDVVKLGPGHWPGTPVPGASGNSVLAGHRTTFTAPFEDLDLLQPGDVIKTRIPGGTHQKFRVYQTTIVPEAEYAKFVLRQPKKASARLLTLFACTPKGFRTHRIVVKAQIVGSINT